jgi:hypothetical protein
MGYIGLLLNDPYKRDRIDGWLLDIFLSYLHVSNLFCFFWAMITRGVKCGKRPKRWVTRYFGVYRPFIECPLQDR